MFQAPPTMVVTYGFVLTERGNWHKVLTDGAGVNYSAERCNLDDAEVEQTSLQLPKDAKRCKRCFKYELELEELAKRKEP